MISESQIIQRYFSSFGRGDGVTLGVGDDGAALHIPPGHELVVSTDTQVAGSHFFADVLPEDIGYRVIATAASDLVVGTPSACMASLIRYSRKTEESVAFPSPPRENGVRPEPLS